MMVCCTGTALGDGGSVLFAFDPVSRAFLYCGRPLDMGLQTGPDGKIFYDGVFLIRSQPTALLLPCTKKKTLSKSPVP